MKSRTQGGDPVLGMPHVLKLSYYFPNDDTSTGSGDATIRTSPVATADPTHLTDTFRERGHNSHSETTAVTLWDWAVVSEKREETDVVPGHLAQLHSRGDTLTALPPTSRLQGGKSTFHELLVRLQG